ncbi:hypothetical protein NWFMUON74_45230 [Nocardia wallacei]|uniref:Uncharacterized protein n=1 Tax=Nocardia wallacei TaxID=480035 RepID=A0A7G1KPI0_9NOCA|nr:hypothetical protein NWFMUON74_45230 [Nocardia wallacei]
MAFSQDCEGIVATFRNKLPSGDTAPIPLVTARRQEDAANGIGRPTFDTTTDAELLPGGGLSNGRTDRGWTMVVFDWWREDADKQQPEDEPEHADRLRAQRRREQILAEDARAADAGLWPNGWPHETPDHPLSVHEAQKIMQRHRGCSTDECPRKAAAWQTLVEAGKIKPDSSRVV